MTCWMKIQHIFQCDHYMCDNRKTVSRKDPISASVVLRERDGWKVDVPYVFCPEHSQ